MESSLPVLELRLPLSDEFGLVVAVLPQLNDHDGLVDLVVLLVPSFLVLAIP